MQRTLRFIAICWLAGAAVAIGGVLADVAAHGYVAAGLERLAVRRVAFAALVGGGWAAAVALIVAAAAAAAAWLLRRGGEQPTPIRTAALLALGAAAGAGVWMGLVWFGGGSRLPPWAVALVALAGLAAIAVPSPVHGAWREGPRPVRGGRFVPAVAAVVAGVAVAGWLWGGGAVAGVGKDRPNVLMIVVDTLRFDRLGYAGGQRPVSPALDRLAAGGTRFDAAYSHAPWTSPAVASLLTSRYPPELGYGPSQQPARLADRFTLLPEILSAHGYRTEAIVAHTYVGSKMGFDQGFDRFDETNAKGHDHISSPNLTDKALAYLDGAGGQPFFLFVHYFDPHFAYIQHPEYPYDMTYTGTVASGEQYGNLLRLAKYMDGRDLHHLLALYDSEIAYTDEHIGRLLDGLEAAGLADSTIVVLAADHGEAFLDRDDNWIGHGRTLYNELIHVPLVVRVPGQEASVRVTEPVGLVDVVPSLLPHLGIDPPPDLPLAGRELPLADPDAWRHVGPAAQFAETKARGEFLQAAVRGNWKLIADRRTGGRELYRLDRDPGERTNLWHSAPVAGKRLEAELDKWAAAMDQLRGRSAAVRPDLTEEEVENLRGLGYLQ